MHIFLSSLGLTTVEWLLSLSALVVVWRRDRESQFRPVLLLLSARVGSGLLLYAMILLTHHGVDVNLAYRMYFFTYWAGFALEAALSLLVIYGLFKLAMAPLTGINELGKVVFRWAAIVSVALTAAVLTTPHPIGTAYLTGILMDFQRAQGVMTLCLLLFVCQAIRPLGLTYRSRTFGVMLVLGVFAVSNLISSGWLAYYHQMFSFLNMSNSITTCSALLILITVFVVREPKRRIVVLPTTSPYLQWNQVAQALGDPPGFVAIAGVPPELFAPAELEMLRLASAKIAQTNRYLPLYEELRPVQNRFPTDTQLDSLRKV